MTLTEAYKADVIGSVPSLSPVLFTADLQGRGATLIDRSPNANGGTIANATWLRTIRGHKVLRFNGVNAKVTHTSAFGDVDFLNTAFSISVWLRHNTTGSYIGVVDMLPNAAAKYAATMFKMDTERVEVVFRRLDNGATVGSRTQDAVTANVWYHMGYTFDGGGVVGVGTTLFYINGAVQATIIDFGADNVSSDRNKIVWGRGQADKYWWSGDQGLRFITGDVLSAAEMATIFNRQRHHFGV